MYTMYMYHVVVIITEAGTHVHVVDIVQASSNVCVCVCVYVCVCARVRVHACLCVTDSSVTSAIHVLRPTCSRSPLTSRQSSGTRLEIPTGEVSWRERGKEGVTKKGG